MRNRLTSFLLHAALALGAFVTLFPLLWMFSASLMQRGDANSYPPLLVPPHPTLDRYRELFTRLDVAHYLLNSLFVALGVTFCSLMINSLAGYAFAKLRFPGRERVFRLLLAAMVVPGQIAMLPLFLMLRTMGLVNSLWGVIVPGMASIFGIFLIRQYAMSISDELIEAARVDGAGEFRIYWSIVLPLCRPVLVTLAVFSFLGAWSDFMWPLVVLTDGAKYTLPVGIAALVGEHAVDTELMMAGSVLTVLPVLLLFLALQRYYIEGIMMGGVKE